MNKIKTLSLAAVLVASVALAAMASSPQQRVVPRDQNGNPAEPLYGGFLHQRNSATDELIACSGRCVLAALIMGSGPQSSVLTVRNSSVADGGGAIVLRRRFVQSNTQPTEDPFPPYPILLDKGITTTLSNAGSFGEDVVVLYIDLD